MRWLLLFVLLPSVAMGAVDSVKVKGTVRDIKGNAVQGVVVVASLSGATNVVDTTSSTTATIVANIPVKASISDSSGYWFMYLQASLDFADTQYYNISGVWGNTVQFDIRDLFLPDIDSLNLADSIKGR